MTDLFGDPNNKLKRDDTRQFSLPAVQGECGTVTCPYRGDCETFCYAGEGTIYTAYPAIDIKHNDNLTRYLTDPERFISDAISEIKRARKPWNRRIHDRGDYFTRDYVRAWYTIVDACPEITFYSYTKSLPLFNYKSGWIKPNLFIRFSYGGKLDHKIDPRKHYHAKVFKNDKAIKRAGYTPCPHDSDILAFDDSIYTLGIPVHGQNARNFQGDQ